MSYQLHEPPAYASPRLKKEAEDLNGLVTVHNEFEAECAAEVEKLRQIPIEKIGPGLHAKTEALKGKRIDVLLSAIPVFRAFRAYDRSLQAERHLAIDQAHAAVAKARADLDAGLIKLGYVIDESAGVTLPNIIYFRHPGITAKRVALEDLQQDPFTYLRAHYSELEEQIERELLELRNQAVSQAIN